MIKLKNGYGIVSDGKSYTLVQDAIQKSKEGVETISNLGRYRWDEDIENWISFEEDFKRFNENWDKFTRS